MSAIVSDTSPIRALDHLNILSLLGSLYGRVLIPPAVAEELINPDSALPPLDWQNISGLHLQVPQNIQRIEQFRQTLDPGESEAIALALEVGTAAVLIDERAGRLMAVSVGLRPVGVLAMLVRDKELGLLPAVAPLMDELRMGIGFRISPMLYAEILRLAKE